MDRRRIILGNQLQLPGIEKLYFYAKMTSSLTADYAHDNNTGYTKTTGAILQNNELYIDSVTGQQIFFNCYVPVISSITLSSWVTVDYNISTNVCWNKMFGFAYNTQNTQKSGIIIAKNKDYIGNTIGGFYCNGATTTAVRVPHLTKTFVTYTAKSLGNNQYNIKVYANGILTDDITWTEVSGWYFTNNSRFIIGWSINGNSSGKGYYSHFSCFQELTDLEIFSLYQNGGVPKNM